MFQLLDLLNRSYYWFINYHKEYTSNTQNKYKLKHILSTYINFYLI
jgi:hypothetical protein